jgi:UDP-N-acetylglucosamine--N-acetylmuramyl-(pentapeptide) pyrophosphoryl-undecaprenol N-acetylglucosamine transferase
MKTTNTKTNIDSNTTPSRQPCALVMAGGTGGHIFPGLAVAQALRERGWRVHWLGAPNSMEERLVPPQGFPLEPVVFSGVRGKGWRSLLTLPGRLLKALSDSHHVLTRVRPDVVIGLGGYITVPGGLMAILGRYPLMLHEQNSVAGWANKLLARGAKQVFSAYPNALPDATWIGNPLRTAFTTQPEPKSRFANRTGPLRVLVLGGSLGAQALNEVVPLALAKIPVAQRPAVIHQGGMQHLASLQQHYAQAGVKATLLAFIDDTAQAMADADVVICRAGASTVTELAAVGAASILVPFPYAVDDHQTHNARFLVDAQAARLIQQNDLTPDSLSQMLQKTERLSLEKQAVEAKKVQKINAVADMVAACEAILIHRLNTHQS